MPPVIQLAIELIVKYQLKEPPGPYRLFCLARKEGILLARYPFRGRIAGIYYRFEDGTTLLTVRKGLLEPELKHVLARALAQYSLEEISEIYLRWITPEKEDAAQEIAALLLMPPGSTAAEELADIHTAAETFTVPVSVVRLRLRLEERLQKLLPPPAVQTAVVQR